LSSVHPILNLEAERARAGRGNDPNRELPPPGARPKDESTTSEEDRLLQDFQAGDSHAFGLLVHRYQDRLYTALVRFLDRPEDALDVLQDTFLSAFANARNFKGNSRFYTWIYRIAMNHAIDHHRRKKPRQSLSIFAEDQADMSDQRSQTQPADHLEREEDRELVQLALQQLSTEHRMVLVMKEIDDLRYEEIAEVLDVPVGTVRSRLHRARADLKDILEKMSKDTK
jgi:RNA polymerase sigma-70 factor, ECF subfamily